MEQYRQRNLYLKELAFQEDYTPNSSIVIVVWKMEGRGY